jgi:hypothetical protein
MNAVAMVSAASDQDSVNSSFNQANMQGDSCIRIFRDLHRTQSAAAQLM